MKHLVALLIACFASAGLASPPAPSYAARVQAAVRPYIAPKAEVPPDAQAHVRVALDASGAILTAALSQSSGHPAWDAAVLRAVQHAGRLPLMEDGRAPAELILVFLPSPN